MNKVELNPPEDFDWDSEGIDRRVKWWKKEIDEGGALFLAENNDQLKGFSVLGKEKAGKTAELVALFIDKDYRGQGIGRKLMELAENEAKRRGIETLYVQSNETVGSVEFYQKVGFTIVCLMDPTTIWLPMMGTSIILAKKL